MELSKDDIARVAYRRFDEGHMKYFYALLFWTLAILVGLTLGLQYAFPENIWPVVGADIPIMVLFCMGVIRYGRAQKKAARELVEECEANPTLIYVPEVAKDAQKVIN